MFELKLKNKNYFQFNYAGMFFNIWDEGLIENLLGKNKQNPVNAGSSNWKKEIIRYDGENKKVESNRKYTELKDLIKKNLDLTYFESSTKKEKIEYLRKFKEDKKWRIDFLKNNYSSKLDLKTKIKPKYLYIVISLHIAKNYSFLDVQKNISEDSYQIFDINSKEDLINYYYDVFKNQSQIENLNSLCFNLYFWVDLKLNYFDDCLLHDIIEEIILESYEETISEKINDVQKETTEHISFNQDTYSIDKLLSPEENIFVIPNFQREYSWTEKETSQFMSDFFSVYYKKDSISMYFMGTLIFRTIHSGENLDYLEVIDGQQRLTTILIFIRVLNDLIGNDRFTRYLKYKQLGESGKEIVKLTMNKNNEPFFYNLIITDDEGYRKNMNTEEIDHDSNKYIFHSYNFIKKVLSDEQKKSKKDKNVFYETILDTLRKKFVVTTMTVSNVKTANLIFEVLNTRGKDLKNFEILKSYIIGRYPRDSTSLASYWNTLISTYGDSLEKYLLAVLASKYETSYNELSKKGIINFFTDRVKDSNDYLDVSFSLGKEIKTYSNLINEKFQEKDSDMYKEKVKLINKMGYESVHKVLLSALVYDEMRKNNNYNLITEKILNLMLRAIFKNKFSDDKPGILNTFITSLSKELRNLDEIDISSMYKQDVILGVDKVKIKNNYLYGSIYKRKTESTKILKILNNLYTNNLTTEHILEESQPDYREKVKKIESEGKKTDPDFRFNKDALYNLTLLTKSDNRSLNNKSFDEKIASYEKYSKDGTLHCTTTAFLSKFKDGFSYDELRSYEDFLWDLTKKRFNL